MKKIFTFFLLFNLSFAKLPFKIKGEIPSYILKQIENTYTNEPPQEIAKIISNIPTFKAYYEKEKNTIYVFRYFYIKKFIIEKAPKDLDKNLLISFLSFQKYTKYDFQKEKFLKLYLNELLKALGYKVKKISFKKIYKGKEVIIYISIDATKKKQIDKKINLKQKIQNALNFLKTVVREKPKTKKKKNIDKNKIGLIIFYGLERTPLDSFKDAILLKPGNNYSEECLKKSINLLYSSGYFLSIKVKKIKINNKIHLIFDVRDAPKYKIKSYIGYNFLYGPLLNLDVKAISPFRKGNIFSLYLKYQKGKLLDITFEREKDFLSLNLKYKKETLKALSSKTLSLSVKKLIFTLRNTFTSEIGLAYKNINQKDLSRIYLYINFLYKRKNLDSSIFPTKGYILKIFSKYMFSFDLYYNIIKFSPKFTIFLPLKAQIFTYRSNLNIGYLKNLSNKEDTSEYFYLGGFESLRGFEYKSIGPLKSYFNFQNDIIYRIRDKIFLGSFFDFAISDLNEIYSSLGLEGGLITPLGDILFFSAYKIKSGNQVLKTFKDKLSFGFIIGLSF